ncbi:MAG: hypothetical protein RL660_472 [Bacteroidota bacterium]|jgi:hypothetical protein
MSHITRLKQQYAINKLAIERELHWTPLEYATYQYEQMLAFIHLRSGYWQEAAATYERSAEYRKWWVNQWNLRDFENLQRIEQCSSVAEARALYMQLHDAEYLQNNYWERETLCLSEAYTIGRVIDELKTKELELCKK